MTQKPDFKTQTFAYFELYRLHFEIDLSYQIIFFLNVANCLKITEKLVDLTEKII